MKSLNTDEVFPPILAAIEKGEIKTTHNMRLILENLSEQYNLRALKILEMFRVWLAEREIDLSTENGMVTISKMKEE